MKILKCLILLQWYPVWNGLTNAHSKSIVSFLHIFALTPNELLGSGGEAGSSRKAVYLYLGKIKYNSYLLFIKQWQQLM